MIESNLLSLSYGRIVQKNINDNDGLLPASFETYQIVEPDDVVWRLTDLQNDKRSLRTARVPERGIITSAYLATRPQRVAPGYFSYLLRAYDLLKVFYSMGGGLRQGMKFSDVRRLPILLPPPPEQAAIAAFLDRETGKIDALVEAQRRLTELLKEKRQVVISHAVTKGLDPTAPMKDSGVEWLGEVPAHWDITALKRSWSVTDCKHVTAEFVDDGVPLASIREVQSRFVDLGTAKQTTEAFYLALIEGGRRPEAGDLIFSRNATVGEVAEVSALLPPFAMGQDVCLLRKEDVRASSPYLYHVIRSRIVQDQLALAMIGSTFKRVNVEEIRDLVIPTPPPLEQHAIADFVAERAGSFHALIDQAEAAIALLHERRSALISAAVTGKIDVRGLVTEQVEAA
jgi:type I restriction enzyme S subunit